MIPNTIKVKTKNKNIRKLDRNVVYTKNMKDKLLKGNRISYKTENEQEENEVNYATDKVMYTTKRVGINTAYGIKDTTKIDYQKIENHVENNRKQKDEIRNKKRNAQTLPESNTKNNDIKFQEKMKGYTVNKTKTNKLKNKKDYINSTKNIGKKSIKTIQNIVKKVINVIKGSFILISSGGFALIIIIIAVIIAGKFGSAFGLLFSNETPETEENMSVNSAVNFLDEEVDSAINSIKNRIDYDTIRIENRSIVWREVLSVYAVITTNRENRFNIMNMNDHNYKKLEEIFWKVVDLDYYTERYTVRVVSTDSDGNRVTKTKRKTRLIINVESLSIEEMMDLYKMNKSERKQVEEMMNNQFNEMWNGILNN